MEGLAPRSRSTFPLHTCKGVHEGGQGPVEHLEERVSAGIARGPTQHRVLQDVRDPCAVHGSRSELDAGAYGAEISERGRRAVCAERQGQPRLPEEVIGVISGCMKVLGSGLIMPQLHRCEKQIRDGYDLQIRQQRFTRNPRSPAGSRGPPPNPPPSP